MNHNEHTEPRIYELGYHLVPTLADGQIPEASGAVRGMIERISKDIIAEELPVFIDLAYQIVKTIDHKNKRFDEAYFGWIKFEASPVAISELEEGLKKDENVLRYIIVKTVRENTFIAKKFASTKVRASEEEVVAAVEETAVVAPVEDALDKAIEELVA
ncbi:MAG: 30S ribosomal protein S6 [Candidatus Yonathbacteria bacterium]|nr:30S ribosomal protein S6 [Candidatus Yonathbacteria bacterium]